MSSPNLGSADDRSEYFDLCDERGRPLGRAKPRGLVHRHGDWHRAFHCWVVNSSPTGVPRMILQQRTRDKETWGGLWDVSVGGHYAAGEGTEGGIREIREELGLVVRPDELLHAGWRREEVFHENGVIEREVQDVYFLRRDLDLDSLHPDPAEVVGVAFVSAAALMSLAGGRVRGIDAAGGRVQPDRRVEEDDLVLEPEMLVPRQGNYYARAARVAERVVQGRPPARRRWWA